MLVEPLGASLRYTHGRCPGAPKLNTPRKHANHPKTDVFTVFCLKCSAKEKSVVTAAAAAEAKSSCCYRTGSEELRVCARLYLHPARTYTSPAKSTATRCVIWLIRRLGSSGEVFGA